MALQSEELFGSAVTQKSLKRAKPHADGISVGTFAALGADAEVPHLTPLYFDLTLNGGKGFWTIWSGNGGGADDPINGLLWAPGSVGHLGLAAGETQIQVFKAGLVHRDDVPLPAGEAQAGLDTALRAGALREQGIIVQGLDAVA